MNQTMMTTEIKDRLRLAAAKAYTSTAKNRPRGLSIEALVKLAQSMLTRPEDMRDYVWNYTVPDWLKTEIRHLIADDRKAAQANPELSTWIEVAGVQRPATGYRRRARFSYSRTEFWGRINPAERLRLAAIEHAENQAQAERERLRAERAQRLVEAVRIHLQLPDAAAAINEIQAVVGGNSYANYGSMRKACGVVELEDEE